jgi:hypothetical protein
MVRIIWIFLSISIPFFPDDKLLVRVSERPQDPQMWTKPALTGNSDPYYLDFVCSAWTMRAGTS